MGSGRMGKEKRCEVRLVSGVWLAEFVVGWFTVASLEAGHWKGGEGGGCRRRWSSFGGLGGVRANRESVGDEGRWVAGGGG